MGVKMEHLGAQQGEEGDGEEIATRELPAGVEEMTGRGAQSLGQRNDTPHDGVETVGELHDGTTGI